MKRVKVLIGFILMVEGVPGLLRAIELQPGAVKAWDGYVRSAGLRMQARSDIGSVNRKPVSVEENFGLR